jgi:PiT family inorganic phosphate transporter
MKPFSAWVSTGVVLIALLGGLAYIGVHVAQDLRNVTVVSVWPWVLLIVALAIALGFEFVNGFHDTANAVATVIYTHSLDPNIAVVWSGLCNLIGVLVSTGTVAYSVITLLPVELILKVSYGAGFAMVFALLIAAIIWNIGTWWLGLPASSSHTMVGSIIGVGVANQIMSASSGTSGVDWGQAGNVFKVLLISPLIGFFAAGLLLLLAKVFILTKWARSFAVTFDANHKKPLWIIPTVAITGIPGAYIFLWIAPMVFGLFGVPGMSVWKPISAFTAWNPPVGVIATMVLIGIAGWYLVALFARIVIENADVLFTAPEGSTPPPWPIRALLIFTCSGVSFAHGSNDGQKGMGLIMLILIGTVPTAYALNHAVPQSGVQAFVAASQQADKVIDKHVEANAVLGPDARDAVTHFIATKQLQPDTMIAMRELINDLSNEVALYKQYKAVPANQQTNVRNDMYVVSEGIRLMQKNKIGNFSPAEVKTLTTYKAQIDLATKFIPVWVKVAVALALGMGTMVGWKRIVVTVGEKIGKNHLTYAQGACAELVAMGTIMAADNFGLPVSTTHVLNSGVAGTMAANKSGLQLSTIRNIAMAWIFTLPAAALLSGALYFLFRQFMG